MIMMLYWLFFLWFYRMLEASKNGIVCFHWRVTSILKSYITLFSWALCNSVILKYAKVVDIGPPHSGKISMRIFVVEGCIGRNLPLVIWNPTSWCANQMHDLVIFSERYFKNWAHIKKWEVKITNHHYYYIYFACNHFPFR